MFNQTILDAWPLWVLFLCTVLLLLAGSELGYRIGAWQRRHRADGDRTPTNAITGSTLGLLAFILAFTFGMSSGRFDTKRELVLTEASAILQAYQRATVLPDPGRTTYIRLLGEYVDLRIGLAGLTSLSEVERSIVRSEAIQDSLWVHVPLVPDNYKISFTGALAQLTDLQMKRVRAAAWNRIPSTIVLMLYALAFLGLTTMGYGAGLADNRSPIPSLALILAFSALIAVIVDLERPQATLFQVSQDPIVDVARRIRSP